MRLPYKRIGSVADVRVHGAICIVLGAVFICLARFFGQHISFVIPAVLIVVGLVMELLPHRFRDRTGRWVTRFQKRHQ